MRLKILTLAAFMGASGVATAGPASVSVFGATGDADHYGVELKKEFSGYTSNYYVSVSASQLEFGEAEAGATDETITETGLGMVNFGVEQPLIGAINYYSSFGVGMAQDEAEEATEVNPIDNWLVGNVELGISYSAGPLRAHLGYQHVSTMAKMGDGVSMTTAGLGFRF